MSNVVKPMKIISFIIVITLVVKILGFVRVLLMAKYFGTGYEASAFEAAYRIPDLLFTSIGLALSTTFIPIFAEYLSAGNKKEAFVFTNNVINLLALITIGISVIGVIFAPAIVSIIYQGFTGDIYYLTVHLVRIILPIIIFIALSYTIVGLLQSFGEFKIPASISLPSNAINIMYLIFFSSHWGIKGFAVAVLIGWSTQVLIQIPALLSTGYKYKLTLDIKNKGLRKMLIMVVPIILGTSVQQVNSIVNSALASGLGNNAVAALGYANYLFIVIVGVFTYAVSAVIFPSLARMNAEEDYAKFKSTLNKAIKALMFILAPVMAGLLVLNVPIIQVLLQRGKFDYYSTQLTANVLFFYSLGMIGFGIQEIINRAFYAIQNTKTPMKIGVMGMFINIILNLILVKYMYLGGLALAASIASMSIAAMLVYQLSQIRPDIIEKETFVSSLKVLFASIIMGITVLLAYKSLVVYTADSFWYSMISLLIYILAGAIIYFIFTLLLKIDEAKMIANILANRLLRNTGESER